MTDLAATLAQFPGKRILIVGDVMLDEYVWGTVRRISPEAPVPVVELQKRSYAPGGAGNNAANISGLGGAAELVGVIGADEAGKQLRATLERYRIGISGLLVVEDRWTTTKTRIIAHQQQVVRLDHDAAGGLSPAHEEQLFQRIDERLPHVHGCVLSDYAKGLVSGVLARRLIEGATSLGKPVIVDPKGSDFAKYRGATLVKPNTHEAGMFLKREICLPEDVLEAGHGLLGFTGSAGVLITRGAAGMSLFEKGREPLHIPAEAREVYDVTGAGDTVAGTLAMALAAGAALEQAAHLASLAAAIVVGRVGTAVVQLAELLALAGHTGQNGPAR